MSLEQITKVLGQIWVDRVVLRLLAIVSELRT